MPGGTIFAMLIPALRRRAAESGAGPLLTYYDGVADTRTELSVVTFANWVDKTANLIVDLGHEDGEPIDLALAATHPGHWVTFVWLAAAWQRGCPVNSEPTGADLLVVGPGDPRRAELSVACSLHPLGRGFDSPPVAAVDFVEVFGQPDVHDEAASVGSCLLDGQPLPGTTARDSRILLADPAPGAALVLEALLAPLLGRGSTVVASGCTPERLETIAVTERATIP